MTSMYFDRAEVVKLRIFAPFAGVVIEIQAK